jgi:hypothetical protein
MRRSFKLDHLDARSNKRTTRLVGSRVATFGGGGRDLTRFGAFRRTALVATTG